MNRPDKLFVLGLTGPTGAGKSAVAGMLAAAGLPVHGRRQNRPGGGGARLPLPGRAGTGLFCRDILRPDGTLDRKRLAAAGVSGRRLR